MSVKVLCLFFLVCLNFTANCQNDLRRVSVTSLPEEIQLLQNVSLAVRWTDSLGDNVIVTTQKTQRPSDDVIFRRNARGLSDKGISDYFKESPTFAYHFFIQNDTANLSWKAAGSVKSCDVNTKGNKVKNSLVVTDLDKNKIAEVWLIYKAFCIDDEVPNGMKIIMYENGKRYMLNGTRILQLDGKTVGGEFSFDESFKTAPQIFIKYAKELWKKNLLE